MRGTREEGRDEEVGWEGCWLLSGRMGRMGTVGEIVAMTGTEAVPVAVAEDRGKGGDVVLLDNRRGDESNSDGDGDDVDDGISVGGVSVGAGVGAVGSGATIDIGIDVEVGVGDDLGG